MNTLEITKKIMIKNDILAKKCFGQNFLIDDEVLSNIVTSSDVVTEDTVIEIGPGLGNLTQYILDCGANVIAFEIDKDMVRVLKDRFDTPKLKIIEEDILNAKLDPVLEKIQGNVKIIANLPYYITTPIIFKLLEYRNQITSITIMVQKEVADRIIASPKSKNYGLLTININLVADTEKLFDVPNSSFIPAPKVTSSVVKIVPNIQKEQSKSVNFKIFNDVTRKAFQERRKKLVNSLYNTGLYGLDKEDIVKTVQAIGLNENCRAEELSIEDYVSLSNRLEEKIIK